MSKSDIKFEIQKIYTKDISFQIPQGFKAFQEEWKPKLNINIDTSAITVKKNSIFEILLTVKTKVNCDKMNIFKIEIQQAGIFLIENVKEEQLLHTKNVFCANILYSYVREINSDLVCKGGFPQLCLSPINFEMLYREKLKKNKKSGA